jgi:hypothetical protein
MMDFWSSGEFQEFRLSGEEHGIMGDAPPVSSIP